MADNSSTRPVMRAAAGAPMLRGRATRLFGRIVAVLLVAGLMGPAIHVPRLAAQEGPPIVVGSLADSAPCLVGDALYAPVGDSCEVLTRWETEAVEAVRDLRGISSTVSDYYVKLWAKADVRANLLARILGAIRAADGARTADQQSVVTWLQNVKYRYDIVVLERALSEFREYDQGEDWTGTLATYPWCAYTPPEPYQNDRPSWSTCNDPRLNPFDLGPNYPDLENWLNYGAAGVKGDRFSTADAYGAAGMSAAAIAAAAAVPTGAAIGTTWAALSTTETFRNMIFPFLGKASEAIATIGWKGVTQAVASAASRFAMFSSAAFIVGVVITVLVTTITIGLQMAERTDIPNELNRALADARAMPLRDLRNMISTTNGMAALTELFAMYVTTPDASYIEQPAPPRLEDELLFTVNGVPQGGTVQVEDWSGEELTLELRSGFFVLDGTATSMLPVEAGNGSNISVFRNRMPDGSWGFIAIPDVSTAACLQTSPISCPVTQTIGLRTPGATGSFQLGVVENSAPTLDASTRRVVTAPDGSVVYDLRAEASWGRDDLDAQIQWWREDLRRSFSGPICRPGLTPVPADTFLFGNRCWTRIATSNGNARIEVSSALTRVLATVSSQFGRTASFTAELTGPPGTPVLALDQTSLSGRQGDRVTVTGTITDTSGQSEARRLTFDLGDGLSRSFDIPAFTGGIILFDWYRFTRTSENVTTFEVTLDAVQRSGSLTATVDAGGEQDVVTVPYTFSNVAPTIRSVTVDGCATPCTLVPGRDYTLRVVATDPGPETMTAQFEVGTGGRQSFAVVQQTPPSRDIGLAMQPSQLTATSTFRVPVATSATELLRVWVEDDRGPGPLVYYTFSIPANCCDVETLTVGRVGVPGTATNLETFRSQANNILVRFTPPADEPLPVSWFVECIADGDIPFRSQRTTTATEVVVGPLPTGRDYRCRVTGTNEVGTGATSSNSAPLFIPTDNPVAPTDVTATPALSSVSVAFVPSPLTANPLPRTYPVTCTSSTGGATATAIGSSSPTTVTGLTVGATYTCTVQMRNDRGTSTASVPSASFTMPGVPAAPTAVTAAQVTGRPGRLVVSFTPGVADALAPVTSSRVVCTTTTVGAVARSASGTVSPLTVTGLTPGATYVCRANSTNVLGTGPGSAPSPSVSLVAAPGRPTMVTPAVSGADRLVVSFTPGSAGTTPTSSYRTVCTSTDGGVIRTSSGTSSPITVTALTVGATYRCVVSATNADGTSVLSEPSAPVLVLGAPSAPLNVTVTPTAGRFSVAFTPPANLGAAGTPPVVTYRVVCTSTDGGRARSSQGSASPVVVTGVSAGFTYTCRMSATNPVGTSPVAVAAPVVAS